MNEQELVTWAQEELKFARKALAKARAKLDAFEAENPNAFFEVDKKEYLALLNQQVKDREAALKDRVAELDKFSSPSPSPTSVSTSPQTLSPSHAIELFSRIAGQKLSKEEIRILVKDFPQWWEVLKLGLMDENDSRYLLSLLKTTLKSRTLAGVRSNLGYVFGRTIGTGCGKSILQKLYIPKTGKVMCAKVFMNYQNASGKHSADFEYSLSRKLQPHANIAPIYEMIPFSHETGSKDPLVALVMPLYSLSLSELISMYSNDPVPYTIFCNIAIGLLSAASKFLESGLQHCDIKPDNVMMNESGPVLIDMGAVVSVGDQAHEFTNYYGLDASLSAVTPEYDLFCIVTTLMRCSLPSFELEIRTKANMIDLIKNEKGSNLLFAPYSNISLLLLDCKSSTEAYERLVKSLQENDP